MKSSRQIIIAALLAAALAGCAVEERPTRVAPEPPPTPEQEFSMLDPYGEWMSYSDYGEVWRPNVAYDWSPYRYGEWEWTDRGWLWVSNERFGWVVYHYGYWDFDQRLGWLWFPSYTWTPANVRWFVGEDFIGWAPTPPPGFAVPRPDEDAVGRWWSFVAPRDFVRSDVNDYRYRESPMTQGSFRNEPPDVRFIGRVRGEDIPQYRTEENRVTAHGRELMRVEPRRAETLGGAATPAVTAPTQTPDNLPIGRKRGESTTKTPTTPPPPERGKTRRPEIQQPAPPPPPPPPPPAQPARPGEGAVQGRHATVKTQGEKVDTTKSSEKKPARPVHVR